MPASEAKHSEDIGASAVLAMEWPARQVGVEYIPEHVYGFDYAASVEEGLEERSLVLVDCVVFDIDSRLGVALHRLDATVKAVWACKTC